LGKITIVISIHPSDRFSVIDTMLDISSRRNREEEINQMIEEGEEQFLHLTIKNPSWKVPDLEFKIRRGSDRELLGLEEYYANGLGPLDFHEGSRFWLDDDDEAFMG
jgi:hypothetical protein